MKVKKIIILKYVNFILNLTDWVHNIICYKVLTKFIIFLMFAKK